MARRKKTEKLTVTKILDVWTLGDIWWARVDAYGPKGTISINLGFDTEDKARGCVGLTFDRTT